MMILLVTACVILGIGCFAILAKWLLLKGDIREMGNKLAEIAHIDTNVLVTTSTFDNDIANLSQSINDVLQKSRQDYYQVQRLEATLKRAITNISHDLRTPLTSAKGYLQMAGNPGLETETLHRYHEIIRDRLEALTVLMDSLFAFSRAVEGNVTLQSVNIGNILRDALAGSYAEIEDKGFIVESHIPDAPVYHVCDEDAMKRVVLNLVSNAVVHGNGYLRVSLSDGAGRSPSGELLAHAAWVIEIANKAKDLHLIDVDNIFERFYTADTSRTNKRTGLGLAIAKELIEKMGGSISAEKIDDLLVMRVWLV